MRVKVHKHHIIPRHAGGTDDPSNIEEVTIEEHAERHRILFETHGYWQDKIAWKALSGQIGREEAIKEAARNSNLGSIHSKEWRGNISKALKGRKLSTEHNRNKSLGQMGIKRPKSKEWCENHSRTMSGKPSPFKGQQHSKEAIKKISEQKKLWWEKRKCQTNL